MYQLRKPLEESDKEFALRFERWINNNLADLLGVAKAVSRMHRYLVSLAYHLCIHFLVALHSDYVGHFYDERNEKACKNAHIIVESLIVKRVLTQGSVGSMIETMNSRLLGTGYM